MDAIPDTFVGAARETQRWNHETNAPHSLSFEIGLTATALVYRNNNGDDGKAWNQRADQSSTDIRSAEAMDGNTLSCELNVVIEEELQKGSGFSDSSSDYSDHEPEPHPSNLWGIISDAASELLTDALDRGNDSEAEYVSSEGEQDDHWEHGGLIVGPDLSHSIASSDKVDASRDDMSEMPIGCNGSACDCPLCRSGRSRLQRDGYKLYTRVNALRFNYRESRNQRYDKPGQGSQREAFARSKLAGRRNLATTTVLCQSPLRQCIEPTDEESKEMPADSSSAREEAEIHKTGSNTAPVSPMDMTWFRDFDDVPISPVDIPETHGFDDMRQQISKNTSSDVAFAPNRQREHFNADLELAGHLAASSSPISSSEWEASLRLSSGNENMDVHVLDLANMDPWTDRQSAEHNDVTERFQRTDIFTDRHVSLKQDQENFRRGHRRTWSAPAQFASIPNKQGAQAYLDEQKRRLFDAGGRTRAYLQQGFATGETNTPEFESWFVHEDYAVFREEIPQLRERLHHAQDALVQSEAWVSSLRTDVANYAQQNIKLDASLRDEKWDSAKMRRELRIKLDLATECNGKLQENNDQLTKAFREAEEHVGNLQKDLIEAQEKLEIQLQRLPLSTVDQSIQKDVSWADANTNTALETDEQLIQLRELNVLLKKNLHDTRTELENVKRDNITLKADLKSSKDKIEEAPMRLAAQLKKEQERSEEILELEMEAQLAQHISDYMRQKEDQEEAQQQQLSRLQDELQLVTAELEAAREAESAAAKELNAAKADHVEAIWEHSARIKHLESKLQDSICTASRRSSTVSASPSQVASPCKVSSPRKAALSSKLNSPSKADMTTTKVKFSAQVDHAAYYRRQMQAVYGGSLRPKQQHRRKTEQEKGVRSREQQEGQARILKRVKLKTELKTKEEQWEREKREMEEWMSNHGIRPVQIKVSVEL